MTGSKQIVHWVMRDSSRTLTLGAGQSILGMQQEGQSVIWTGTVDLTDDGKISMREGDWVGFYLTGYDSAGNEFPVVSNSEASPIAEIASDDTDFERQWVRLGAVGPELKIGSIRLSDDHVAPGQEVKITADVQNVGGSTSSQFKVSFYAGNDIVPFDSTTLNKIGADQTIPVSVYWNAEEGIDKIRVQVDPDDVIVEVNDDASNTKSFSTVNVCSAIMCRVGNSDPLSLYSSAISDMSSSGQSHPTVKSKSTSIQGIPDSLVVCTIEEVGERVMKSD